GVGHAAAAAASRGGSWARVVGRAGAPGPRPTLRASRTPGATGRAGADGGIPRPVYRARAPFSSAVRGLGARSAGGGARRVRRLDGDVAEEDVLAPRPRDVGPPEHEPRSEADRAPDRRVPGLRPGHVVREEDVGQDGP